MSPSQTSAPDERVEKAATTVASYLLEFEQGKAAADGLSVITQEYNKRHPKILKIKTLEKVGIPKDDLPKIFDFEKTPKLLFYATPPEILPSVVEFA